MERVLLIPYEVRPSKFNQYELSKEAKGISHGRSSSEDANQRKFYRCFGICSLFMFFLLVAYVPVTFHQSRNFQASGHSAFISGWSQNTSRDLKLYVLPNNITSLLPQSDVCSTPLFLLVVVCSAVQNADARAAIRETWASSRFVRNTSNAVRVAFLLGDPDNATLQEAVEDESLLYGDIIQEGFLDSYNNLTLKSVMLLKYVTSRCGGVRFVMKTDDDMFVNVASLVRFLRTRSPGGLLVGSLICGARPILDSTSKWFAPHYMYSGRVYPNYLSGTGYVMSRDVAKRLYKAALATPLFHLEDVYLTGICSRAAGVKPHDNGAFTFGFRKLEPCLYRSSGVITSHRVTPGDLRKVWAAMSAPDLDCSKVTSTAATAQQKNKQKVAALRKQASKCY